MSPSTTRLGLSDTGGALDLVVSKMRKTTEPPPHVHERDDEFFYILSGSIGLYTGGQVFEVAADESMFLPKGEQRAHILNHHSKTPARTQRCVC